MNSKIIKFSRTSLMLILAAYTLVPLQLIAFILFAEGGFLVTLLMYVAFQLEQILSIILLIVTLVCWKKTSNHILPSIPFLLVVFATLAGMTANYVANMYGMYSLASGIENYSGYVCFLVMVFVVVKYNKFAKQNMAVPVSNQISVPTV
ncbi:hypothetical protein H7X65_01945 [Candidatus Parcubacteria bacterium]|nr:hypothetical protein [Candidatus Parcubacteria bacterium]